MDSQRFAIKRRVIGADDPQLQDALSHVYETPERPRCLCVPGGVEMYVALHRQFVVKRMPDSGKRLSIGVIAGWSAMRYRSAGGFRRSAASTGAV